MISPEVAMSLNIPSSVAVKEKPAFSLSLVTQRLGVERRKMGDFGEDSQQH